jgi:hypothetical protein
MQMKGSPSKSPNDGESKADTKGQFCAISRARFGGNVAVNSNQIDST